MAALPSGVLGLVECWAFCRLDFWFFSETIIWNLPSDGENIWDLRDASGNYFVRQISQRALTLGVGQHADDLVNRNARALDAGLTVTDIRVNRDPVKGH